MGRRLKSQAVGEYVIFITAIIAALVGMQVYFTRSLQGRHKQYTDYMAMGAEPFSGAHSNYNRVAELLPFDSERTVKNPDGQNQYFSFEEDRHHRITRIISGDVWVSSINGADFFSASAPGELKALFSDTDIDLGYVVANERSVVDDFSGRKLYEDVMFQ